MLCLCAFNACLLIGIHRCTWSGETCENSSIITTFTDMGLCYTFNGDANNIRRLHKTGKVVILQVFVFARRHIQHACMHVNFCCLWWVNIHLTWLHCRLAFAPASGVIHVCSCSCTGKRFLNRKETRCFALLSRIKQKLEPNSSSLAHSS